MAADESEANRESPDSIVAQDSESALDLDLMLVAEPLKSRETSAASTGENLESAQPGTALSEPVATDSKPSLIILDKAKQQIGEATLSALAENFNGKLSGVRPVDSNDVLF